MPIKVSGGVGGAEWENHFNLLCLDSGAVRVHFFSQRCLLVGNLSGAYHV